MTSYPNEFAQGERYRIPAGEPACPVIPLPTDKLTQFRAVGLLRSAADPESQRRGRALYPAGVGPSSEYLASVQRAYRSNGRFSLVDVDGLRGKVLSALFPVGCVPNSGTITDDFAPNVLVSVRHDESEVHRLAEVVEGSPFLTEQQRTRGKALQFRAVDGCPNLRTDIDFDPVDGSEIGIYEYLTSRGLDVDEQTFAVPYYIDLFGQECAMCPVLFITFERPCLGCSYRPEHLAGKPQSNPIIPGAECPTVGHEQLVYDWNEQRFNNVGPAHCIPNYIDAVRNPGLFDPNWKIACDLDVDGAPQDHHCEPCVYERCLGILCNDILVTSDVLSKVPMIPDRTQNHYGCGRFGWKMWTERDRSTLRIPNFLSPGEQLEIWEEPCTCTIGSSGCERVGASVACYNSIQPTGTLFPKYQSGYGLCGTGLTCDCSPGDFIFCASTHIFRWDKFNPGNRIKSAWMRIRQHEMCDPQLGPCASNPEQRPGAYNNPSSEIIAWVDCGYQIDLKFFHWGPSLEGIADHNNCGCCLYLSAFPLDVDSMTVHIHANFSGPIVVGNRGGGFAGHPLFQGARPYPERWPNNPAASYPGISEGWCGHLFVNQGDYGDPIGKPPGQFQPGDPSWEPPKRCPSWRTDTLSGSSFWCPPNVRNTFNISGTHRNDWSSFTLNPNQHQQRRQCWSAETIRNRGGCSEGTIFDNNEVKIGCTDPDCRRGCSFEETHNPFTQDFQSPHDPTTPRATPGGCGQCVPPYPVREV